MVQNEKNHSRVQIAEDDCAIRIEIDTLEADSGQEYSHRLDDELTNLGQYV